jgi:hypothetical protein
VDTLIHPTKCKVKNTLHKGYGVFATQPIYRGEIIEECHLLFVPKEISVQHPDLFFDYVFNYPANDDKSTQHCLPLGFGCIYNHSDNNNAIWRGCPRGRKIFQFIAIKDIQAGEEICTRYGNEIYWSHPSRAQMKIY